MSNTNTDSDSSLSGKRKEVSPPEFANRSKKKQRTPNKRDAKTKPKGEEKEEKEMEEIKEMLKVVLQDNNSILKEIKCIKEEQREYRKEMEALKNENKELKERIKVMEMKFEEKDKRERAQNIVIKGLEIKNRDKGKEEVQMFLEDYLGINADIETVHNTIQRNGMNMSFVKLKTFEDKTKIMHKKKVLKGKNIYIDSDLTEEERGVQKILRDMAKTERNKGRKVKVAYQKLITEDKIWYWDNQTGKLTDVRARERTNQKIPIRTESRIQTLEDTNITKN